MNVYPPLQLGTPGKPACPDEYTTASTLLCPGCSTVLLQIGVAAVYVSFGVGVAAPDWGPDEPFLPLAVSQGRSFDAVRVKNFTPGLAAQVLISARAS